MTAMPLIELALEGKCAYLRAINGIPDEPEPTDLEDMPGMTPADGPDGLGAYLRRRMEG